MSSYQFKTVFVDPPRAGLDKDTLKLVSEIDNISIYLVIRVTGERFKRVE